MPELYTLKPIPVQAMQFTGTLENVQELIPWLNECGYAAAWIPPVAENPQLDRQAIETELHLNNHRLSDKLVIRKNLWIVWDPSVGRVTVMAQRDFDYKYAKMGR